MHTEHISNCIGFWPKSFWLVWLQVPNANTTLTSYCISLWIDTFAIDRLSWQKTRFGLRNQYCLQGLTESNTDNTAVYLLTFSETGGLSNAGSNCYHWDVAIL